MAHLEPGDPRRPDDYIERTGGVGWTPLVVAAILLALAGVLLLGPPRSADRPSTTAERGELPNAAPAAPSPPAPAPPKPQ
jgi:hypothetical protein